MACSLGVAGVADAPTARARSRSTHPDTRCGLRLRLPGTQLESLRRVLAQEARRRQRWLQSAQQ
eukprot:11213684-Lingulodinium_polyedra.AAC.1